MAKETKKVVEQAKTRDGVTVAFDFEDREFTIGDLAQLEDWGNGLVRTREMVELLQGYVTNDIDLLELPYGELRIVVRQVMSTLGIPSKN